MARITISGKVLYNDFKTPAAGAEVNIVEVDALDGGADDIILSRTADDNGLFNGRSKEWNDGEGTGLFGIAILDVFQLRFVVKVDGKTHRGSFVVHNNKSLPIILPWSPPKAVPKAKRELVQIILVSKGYVDDEKALYEFIETSTEALTLSILGGSYRKITFLKGEAATLPGFVGLLDDATSGTAQAVDLIFTTHGSTDQMEFYDGQQTRDAVGEAVGDIPEHQRKKLRCVFSTACYGASHRHMWINAGFNDASGARKMYADAAASYAPFLASWAAEETFAQAVNAANAADVGDIADNIARAYYAQKNKPDKVAQIDSHRERSGTGQSRIYTKP